MSYQAVIGLEVHVELATETKLYCRCKNVFGGEPNTRICPVCTGQPGAMPSTNKKAVYLALRACRALGCRINKLSAQCRKHYFYPDLPKGYQISQTESPLGISGSFSFVSEGKAKEVKISEVHIEEDAGKLVHLENEKTGVDYNRAGVPLIEIVTQPCMGSAKEARDFLESLRRTLIRAGVSECRMEEGALRCDVNVSLRKNGDRALSERVELKNVNSFSGVFRAIEDEVLRQEKILRGGGTVARETRRWDDEKKCSYLMRTKESILDYKFMPEPDIPVYEISDEDIVRAEEKLPKSEVSRFFGYIKKGVSKELAEIILADIALSDFFDLCEENHCECAKLLCGEVSSILSKKGITLSECKLTSKGLCEVSSLVADGRITRQSAKEILGKLIASGGDALALSKEYEIVNDEADILSVARAVLSENEKAVSDFRAGKEAALTFLMGQCMRKLRGRGNANTVSKILVEQIEGKEVK